MIKAFVVIGLALAGGAVAAAALLRAFANADAPAEAEEGSD